MGLGARIWALRLGFGPQNWDLGLETEGVFLVKMKNEFVPDERIFSVNTFS